MPNIDTSLVLIGTAPLDVGTDKARSKYLYPTNDALATVVAANYFNNSVRRLLKGDSIEVTFSQGGAVGVQLLVVASNDGTNVTTAKQTDPGALALINNTGGNAAAPTLVAGAVATSVTMAVQLADLANAGVLKIVPGFRFKANSVGLRIAKPATTAAKLATLTAQISGVAMTGGVISATSANATPAGALIAGTAITALNTGSATDTLEINPSAVTAFVEGDGWIEFNLTDLDLADALSALNAN